MKRVLLFFLTIVLFTAKLPAQNAPPVFYVESFRQGATRVTEERFDLNLTPKDPTYLERVKDAQGKERYEFAVTPQMPGGDDKITSWSVTLRDLRHVIYGNLLVATHEEPSDEATNNLGWLNPNRFSPVPIRAKRIIKVEGFSVVIQVKDMHFTPLDSPYLDSMTVSFSLTDTDPRESH